MSKTSSLILAGGRGRRLKGVEKALIPCKGGTLIEHIIAVLDPLVDDIVVSVRDGGQMDALEPYIGDCCAVVDRYHDTGPLAGILEGLKAAGGEYTFVTACDMPYLNSGAVELLFERAIGHDCALPVGDNGVYEPLHAVYRTASMLDETQKAIERGERFILAPIFKLEDVVTVGMDEIRKVDPYLKTFLNINTMQDMEQMLEK